MLENFPKASDLPFFIALAAAPACGTGKIPLDGDTAVEPAEVQLTEDTAAEPTMVTANEDGQNLGCLGLTAAIDTQIQAVFVANQGFSEADGEWIDNPAAAGEGGFIDRSAALYSEREALTDVVPAGTAGDLAFRDMAVELGANTAYELCIIGNPGATTGTFRHVINQDGLVTDTSVGSSQTFPLAFAPFTVE